MSIPSKETKVTDKGIRHVKNMPRLYNLMLSGKVTSKGRRWLAENARFAPSLQTQLRKAARAAQNRKTNEMDLQAFRASLKGTDAIVFHLGQSSRDSKTEEARQQLLKMNADAIGPILDMVEKCSEQGHPLGKDSRFKWNFRNNASVILRAVSTKSMPALADHFAQSSGKREVISRALESGEGDIIPHLEVWLQHESPLVRLEALQQLARRATVRWFGHGTAAHSTRKHNSLHLSKSGRKQVYALLTDKDARVQQAACTVVVAANDDLSVKAKILAEAALREKNSMTLYRMQEALFFLADQQPIDSKELLALINEFMIVLRKSDNTEAQHIAMHQLGKLGGKAQPAIDLLQGLREGTDEKLAATAGRALDQIRRCPITLMRAAGIPVEVQNLVFTLTRYDREAIDRATKELVRRGPSMFRPLLTAARGEVDEYYPPKAAAIVAQWKQDDVLPILRPVFNQKSTSVRLFVIHSISQMKRSELPDVVKDSLEGVDAKVRNQMRHSLSTLARNTTGRASRELARLIAAELKHPVSNWGLASSLTDSLTMCYPDSSEVPSLLLDILNQDAQYTSAYACRALGKIAYDHLTGKTDDRKKFIEAILGMLQTTKNEDLKRECMGALARFGPEAREALPTLRQIQKEGSENLATSAKHAITSIDRSSKQTNRDPQKPASEDPPDAEEPPE